MTTFFVFIKIGSIHENENYKKGAVHFIEHMCFKGTTQNPTSLGIRSTYDDRGAFFNAETTRQYTCYKVKCMNKFIVPCLNTLADILLHSVLKKKEMDLERHVVLEENIRAHDNPQTHIEDAIYKALYAGTPYSDPIDTLEYHKSSHTLEHINVVRMYREYYCTNNMGISFISNLSFGNIKHLLENTTFMTRSKDKLPPMLCLETPPKNFPDIQYKIIHKKGIQSTHVSISFRTCPHHHDDVYPLLLLKNIIGGYMSSRLFMLLREKNGLTYSSAARSLHNGSSGHFEIYTLCNPSKILKNELKPGVLPLLLQVLNDLLQHGITQKELTSTKGFIQGQMILGMEQSENKTFYNGIEYILYDKPDIIPYEHIFQKKIEPITKDIINQVIHRYFHPENMFVCLVGEHSPDLTTVQRYCRHFPVDQKI